MIYFNGICGDDLGVIVEHYPQAIFPEKKIITYDVPGRNGTEVIDTGYFSNYDQSYDVFFDAKSRGGLNVVMPQIASWLLGENGYCRLEDSYFPDYFRYAIIKNGHEFLSYFQEYGRGTLTFNCKPERYFKSGEREITVLNGQTVYNPSGFKAEPIYLFDNSQTNTSLHLTEAGVTRTVTIPQGPIRIDTKAHANTNLAMSGSPNFNYMDAYETLFLGKETTFTWEGNVTSFKIIPNWWTI